jgi:hypothetical protein
VTDSLAEKMVERVRKTRDRRGAVRVARLTVMPVLESNLTKVTTLMDVLHELEGLAQDTTKEIKATVGHLSEAEQIDLELELEENLTDTLVFNLWGTILKSDLRTWMGLLDIVDIDIWEDALGQLAKSDKSRFARLYAAIKRASEKITVEKPGQPL